MKQTSLYTDFGIWQKITWLIWTDWVTATDDMTVSAVSVFFPPIKTLWRVLFVNAFPLLTLSSSDGRTSSLSRFTSPSPSIPCVWATSPLCRWWPQVRWVLFLQASLPRILWLPWPSSLPGRCQTAHTPSLVHYFLLNSFGCDSSSIQDNSCNVLLLLIDPFCQMSNEFNAWKIMHRIQCKEYNV